MRSQRRKTEPHGWKMSRCLTVRLHWGASCSVEMTVCWPLLGRARPKGCSLQGYGHQLAAPLGKYGLHLEVVCTVLDPEDMANRIEYLPLD